MTERRRLLALLPAAAFVVAVAIGPAAILLGRGIADGGGIAGLATLLGDPLNRTAVANSLLQGALSAAGAVVLGYPVGLYLGRYAGPRGGVLRAVLLVPFLLPSVVMAFAIEGLFGPGGTVGAVVPAVRALGSGLGGIVAANVIFNLPLVALLTAVGVESASVELEDAASALGAPPSRVYRDVWAAPSLLGAAAGALVTFLLSALAFAAPLLLCGARCYTIEARVWSLDTVLLEPNAASALAAVSVAFLAVPTALYLVLSHRLRVGRSGRPRPPRPIRGAGPYGVVAVTVGVVGVVVLVLGSVLYRSLAGGGSGSGAAAAGWLALGSPRIAAATGVSVAGAVANTVGFAVAGALVALLLGIVSGFALKRAPGAARGLPGLLFAPLLISPIVLSLALATVWGPVVAGPGSWGLVVAAQATLALPFALESLWVALRSRPAGPREAAEILGARPFVAYLDTDVAGSAGALRTAVLFAFALCLGEFTATYFLTSFATPGFATLPVVLYDLQGPGVRLFAAADAVAGLLVLVSLAVLAAVALGGRRVEL